MGKEPRLFSVLVVTLRGPTDLTNLFNSEDELHSQLGCRCNRKLQQSLCRRTYFEKNAKVDTCAH